MRRTVSSYDADRVAPPALIPVTGIVSRLNLTSDLNLGIALLILVATATLLPVGYAIVQSFNVASVGAEFKFGLSGWQDVFSSSKTLSSIGYSLLLSVRIPIAISIAFVIAWLLIRVQIPGHKFIEYALWFGFFLPLLPITMGWILLLDKNYGIVNALLKKLPFVTESVFSISSIPGIMWVHLTLSSVPIMVILLAPALRQLDGAIEEAADMVGADIFTTLRRITIPLIAPAILTAFIAGFIRSLEVFEIEQLLGTPVGILVYATRIYDLISWDPPLYPQAMALSSLFLLMLLALAMLYQHYLKQLSGRATITGKGARLQPRLRGRWAYVASAIIFLYIAISIVLPLTVLILGSFNRLFGFFFIDAPWTTTHWMDVLNNPVFGRATINSIALGLSAGLIGTILYALLAWVLVRTTIWGRETIALLTWLPWAIPGLLLGVTLLSITLNVPIISGLYGTIAPLVIAMIIKDMPLGVQMLRTSLLQISAELEESAQMSGAGFVTTFRRVTLPLIAPMFIAVFLLMFMATLRDISTVVLLASPGTRTLSLLMFEFATASRLEAAAVIGVIIALISLAITAIAFRVGIKMTVES